MQAKQDTHTPSSFHTIVRPSNGHGTRFDWSVLRCPVPQRNQAMMMSTSIQGDYSTILKED